MHNPSVTRRGPTPPISRLVSSAALSLLAAALAWPAVSSAQSRYAMTTLSPPFLGVVGDELFIDAQHRVLGFAGYFRSAGYGLDTSGSGKWVWITNYNSYISTWRASTAASVSSTKLYPERHPWLPIVSVSPDGSKILLKEADYRPVVHDTATRQPLLYPGLGAQVPPYGAKSNAVVVNDRGWVAGSAEVEVLAPGGTRVITHAARWRGPQAELLPMDTSRFVHAEGMSMNAAGEVSGSVQEVIGNGAVSRAAVWDAHGAMRLLDSTPGHTTEALAIADNGAVLIQRVVYEQSPQQHTLELHVNGQVQALTSPRPGAILSAMKHAGLSPDGDTVVGSAFVVPAAGQQTATRAFIHTQGRTQDLTEMLAAKGVKLPSGAYFESVSAINAQGAMVATYATSGGRRVNVRLTPLP